jgi:hypothetical protein
VTDLYVMNSSESPAKLSVAFYDDTGKPLPLSLNGSTVVTTLSDNVAGNGMKYFELGTWDAPVVGGSALFNSDASITVQVILTHIGSDGKRCEAAVQSSSGVNEFRIPFDATAQPDSSAQMHTGIAIANLDSTNRATVTCNAWDTEGVLIPNAVSVPALNPLGHWADYLFPALNGRRGTIDCTSNTRVGAIGLRAVGDAISSLPVVPIR